jgi:hypothetical protein
MKEENSKVVRRKERTYEEENTNEIWELYISNIL